MVVGGISVPAPATTGLACRRKWADSAGGFFFSSLLGAGEHK